MINKLPVLESKIAQVVALCQTLRAENAQLRQQLVAAESERREMAAQLAQQLPETKSNKA